MNLLGKVIFYNILNLRFVKTSFIILTANKLCWIPKSTILY